MSSALETRFAIQRLLGFEGKELDGELGPKSLARFYELAKCRPTTVWPKGSWAFDAVREGDRLVLRDVWVTCFGGSDDPQDSGATASGISTKDNPDLRACALPMDGRMFPGMSKAEHAALDGSPVPRMPWKTPVTFQAGDKTLTVPVIDLGPGRMTGNAADLTIAAARFFNPKATATNFKMRMTVSFPAPR